MAHAADTTASAPSSSPSLARRASLGIAGALAVTLSIGIFAHGSTTDLDEGALYRPLTQASRTGDAKSVGTLPPPPPVTTTPVTTSATDPATTQPPVTTPGTTPGPTPTTPPSTQPPTTQPAPTTQPPTTQPPTPTTQPAPTTQPPTPTTRPTTVGGDENQLKVGDIRDVGRNYDLDEHLRTGLPLPASTAHEPTGNFRLICEFSHFAYDDPIVAPGIVGASHLHMFFGNTLTSAMSDYESLRTTGDSTCQGGPVNRTAYWAPAVIDSNGSAVTPDFISVYYKGRGHSTDGQLVDVAEIPPGLRMIAGAQPGDPSAESKHQWYCESGYTKTSTIPTCPTGERVGVALTFPTCWDGVSLDSADHRSHLHYTVGNPNTGVKECPNSHPVSIPAITIGIWFSHNGDSASWHLTSDRQPGHPTHENGASFHTDWFGAWDHDVLAGWTDRCINGELNCSWGDLGNGTALSVNPDYTGPQRVTPPALPLTAQHSALIRAESSGVSALTCVLYQ